MLTDAEFRVSITMGSSAWNGSITRGNREQQHLCPMSGNPVDRPRAFRKGRTREPSGRVPPGCHRAGAGNGAARLGSAGGAWLFGRRSSSLLVERGWSGPTAGQSADGRWPTAAPGVPGTVLFYLGSGECSTARAPRRTENFPAITMGPDWPMAHRNRCRAGRTLDARRSDPLVDRADPVDRIKSRRRDSAQVVSSRVGVARQCERGSRMPSRGRLEPSRRRTR